MHAFAVTAGLPPQSLERLTGELEEIGREFKLDPSSAWQCSSRSQTIVAAGMHHASEVSRPRHYLHRAEEELVFFDGLPVQPHGRFDARSATALATHWGELPETLEGQFNAVRVDLEADRAEILMDPLGLLRVFVARRGPEIVAASSVRLIAAVLGCRAPDELGVASMLALGWVVEDRTLLGDITALAGGAVHTIDSHGISARVHFDARALAAARHRPVEAERYTQEMAEMTGQAIGGVSPIRCALTAGRDTRVLLALLQSTGREHEAQFYTGGAPGSADLEVGTELAERLGLHHTIESPSMAGRDWGLAAERFVAQNDGLASLLQLPDYIEPAGPPERLGVTLWGVGGEIGRAGTGPINHVTPNLPVFSSVPEVQRRLMVEKMERASGLLMPEGQALVCSYMDRFVAARRSEGWRTREVYEAFYAFERVGCGGASGPRRASSTSDLFSPYCSRQFMEFSFSLTPGERYLEVPHYLLLRELAPSLLDHRFEVPLHRQWKWAVTPMAAAELIGALRARRRRAPASASSQEPPFLTQWVESQVTRMRDLSESVDASIWRLISRPRLLALLEGGPEGRRAHTEALLRLATVLLFLDA
jgi:hypothetical protein